MSKVTPRPEKSKQQSLDTFLTPQCSNTKDTPKNSAKKRTPPSPSSVEGPERKKMNMEEGSQNTETQQNSKEITDSIVTESNNHNLPRETIDCMKIAMKELIDPIEDKLNKKLEELIDPIEVKINKLLEHRETDRQKQDKVVKEIKTKQSELYRKCLKLEQEQIKIKTRLSKIEDRLLENNLIIHGITEDAWELSANRKERIFHTIAHTVDEEDKWERLEIARNIPIISTTRLGRYRVGKNRPISIVFEKKRHADTLYESQEWLPRGVHVDREFNQDIEDQRKLLRPILNLARSIEHYKGKCKLDGKYLIIQGTRYGANDLHKLPDDLSGFHASSRSNTNVLAFFGELSPFSNFHRSNFTIDDKEYFCSEQYIQEQRALHYNDMSSAKKIMLADSALECKEIGRNIVGGNDTLWRNYAKDKCYPGILAKFRSNRHLADMLLSTGKKTLVEASYDSLWGTGIPLQNKSVLDTSLWKGNGILGEMLMEVRETLQSEVNTTSYHNSMDYSTSMNDHPPEK